MKGLSKNLYEGDREKVWGSTEYMGDVNTLEEVKFTRSRKKNRLTKVHPSSFTYHVAQTIHTIN